MIVGYHLIWTAYGWWLPNDPRGSSSQTIRADIITELGELHHGRKTVQPASSDLAKFYAEAKAKLKYELLQFTAPQVTVIANSFREVIEQRGYTCYGCAVMDDHVHLLIRKHRDQAETMIEQFQKQSRQALIEAGHRIAEHRVWGGPGWKVFLDDQHDMIRTVRYIYNNPIKARRPVQRWGFVKAYDGWLPGIVTKRRPSD